jgi:hypothetical protein
MNVCIRNTFVSLWLFFGAISLPAQGACFYFPFLNNVASGSNKALSLGVVNLDSVVAMQFVIRWDPAVLKYLTIDQINFSDLAFSDFNVSRALDSGIVRLQWEGVNESPGASAPDSSAIFRIRFQVVGPDTSSTPVKITEILDFPATYFEVVKVRADNSNVAYEIDDCAPTNGFVAVGYTVDAGEAAADKIPLSVAPNPFSEQTQLQFELEETADVSLLVTDALGRIIHKKQVPALPPGQHGMVIEKGYIGSPGVYSLLLRAGRKTAIRTLVHF